MKSGFYIKTHCLLVCTGIGHQMPLALSHAEEHSLTSKELPFELIYLTREAREWEQLLKVMLSMFQVSCPCTDIQSKSRFLL